MDLNFLFDFFPINQTLEIMTYRAPIELSRGMTIFSSSTEVDEGFWFRSVVVSQSCVPEPMFEMQGQTPEWNCAKSLLDLKIFELRQGDGNSVIDARDIRGMRLVVTTLQLIKNDDLSFDC